ncbi:BTB/POZ domain-containing protein At2g30600 [Oryza brachyantha]|uniref:BTB domain-containing protein n=1 Tax=Oryza brachyantha TaxID=4533 RepID=J3KUS5_ORYBR|nr:BTB/POZ domain-containing protein At2g30600 [Oryza brachyantha]
MKMEEKKRSITVAPFECAWDEGFQFREAGRGCITFEASAQNDITLVFREQPGSQHYHYKMDNSRHYTVILGSHRNKRLKIEVDGKTVVDVAGIGLCCSSCFQSYWISIYDGLISIGQGRHPNKNILFQWLDPDPNQNVQYVGLSSWDKHVGYRNISLMPSAPQNSILWSQIECTYVERDGAAGHTRKEESKDGSDQRVLANFLENWDFSDAIFVVGGERKVVPAHKVVLGSCGDFPFNLISGAAIELPSVSYPVLHSLLEYIYTGSTQISERQLNSLLELSSRFKVKPLVMRCEEIIGCLKINDTISLSSKKLQLSSSGSQAPQFDYFPFKAPLNTQKVEQFLVNGEHSDVNIHVNGHGLVAHAHKLILSLWSVTFDKMFTNGMKESSASNAFFEDVPVEAFFLLIQFMYSGELKVDAKEITPLLVELLLLSDQFGIMALQFECCKRIMEFLSEDTVCSVLRAVSSIPSCKLIEEMCKRNFAQHFDYCTTACMGFVLLDEAIFKDILQHGDMTVTSEERVLDAVLTWCMEACDCFNWNSVDELLSTSKPEELFGGRLTAINTLLPFVRFPLMQQSVLQLMEKSNLANNIEVFRQLVAEAIEFCNVGLCMTTNTCERFQHRRSSYKELQYISDGDNNGVIYYAGTSFGKHQWINPVLAKNIKVIASSPNSRYTDPKALVSKNYQGTCFAGPRLEDGKMCSWWMVDIGHDHQLMCNYYTVRQDGSTTFMRSWVLQGSMDGQNWTSLRIHKDDQTICQPGQFASWPITGPSALLPFRFFRVMLTGHATGVSNTWNLCICFLELYGYFR